ncbi:hypothetical protein VZT92_001529 [Zoarces viviparus]|uniref:Uncharacterized protein n=1 Tax=Zoarces viviparus TaxID=48416 RepID=A0AAW1G5U9_ZOAVI
MGVKVLSAAPMARTPLCFEGKEGAAVLFGSLAAGLLTPMQQRGPEQDISSGVGGCLYPSVSRTSQPPGRSSYAH